MPWILFLIPSAIGRGFNACFLMFARFRIYSCPCHRYITTEELEQELVTLAEHVGVPPVLVGYCYSIFSFMCMFCRWLFVLLYFFFWPLCCMFLFDIRILNTPLISSNSSDTASFTYRKCQF